MSPISLSRRDFLGVAAAAGTGLVIGFYLPHGARLGAHQGFAPNAYLHISTDDMVTIVVTRSEMGQGVRTALPMMLAEELGADWPRQIQIEQAGASTLYGDQTTGGSASVRMTPATVAAPPISIVISSIPPAGLIEMPPVSNTTPLPTRANGA